jgi:hypothetical protein
MFCMDDREEGIRRHLEELAPEVETLGAAAHFSVPHNWQGIDDTGWTALAPVVPAPVFPAHEIREVPRSAAQAAGALHRRRHAWLRRARNWLLQDGRRGILAPAAVLTGAAPLIPIALLGKVLAPTRFARLSAALQHAFEPLVATEIQLCAPNDSPPATPESPRLGYTDREQAERVCTLFRSSGLTDGFASLVAIIGHSSRNQNNPHASAYNCGACAGRFSGPNARLVAAMANRPAVRALLAQDGISVPADTWFLGADHDTCADTVSWYDAEDVPPSIAPAFSQLRRQMDQACRLHAKERCRRFASAPADLDAPGAHRHAASRAADIAQARPELGHATNACAFIGRRSMSRGAFFDRRAFLISYDPTRDPTGEILEQHLRTNGAVGAGISLEYYFSAVDNARYGSGSKVTHNVTGFFGVMDGAASDLRTGLPSQMIEIHEAMRLLVVVEQSTDVVTAIYQRQPAVRELVANRWVQLAAKDPDSARISLFDPAMGWQRWQPTGRPVPQAACSADWFRGHRGPLPPALIVGAS